MTHDVNDKPNTLENKSPPTGRIFDSSGMLRKMPLRTRPTPAPARPTSASTGKTP
ncbi:MAG: hypothetical protein P1U50_01930 [Parvibaculaceae bacterium]|nr:hypothetical protein [Parvibaculaceae bacterium]